MKIGDVVAVQQAAVGTSEVSATIGGVTQAVDMAGGQAVQVLEAANALTGEAATLQGEVAAIGLTTDIEQPTAPAQPRESRLRAAPVVGVQVRLLDPPPSLLPGLSATVSVRDQR